MPKCSGSLQDALGNQYRSFTALPEKQFLFWLEEDYGFSSEARNQQLSTVKTFQGADGYVGREQQIRECSLETLPLRRDPFIPYTTSLVLKLVLIQNVEGETEESHLTPRLEGGIFNKQGNSHTRLVLDATK